MTKKVLSVINITLEILEKKPPILAINVNGTVSSGGWSNGRLNPFIYVAPPEDGIYEFDFVASEPPGIAIQVITPIHAKSFLWDNFPADLKGIKVYSSTDSLVEKL